MTRKIVQLTASNVKRLTAVEIKPDGTLIVIGGKNGAGKSSVIDSILYALKGAGALPSKPVRDGADHADIELVLDGEPTIVVKRRIKADGKTTLEVRMLTDDGVQMKATSPQVLLDSLCGRIAFDPLAFTRLRPQDQVDLLRQVVGIDLTEIDAEIARLYDERSIANRRLKETRAQIDSLPKYDDAPEEFISVDELVAEMEAGQATNRARADKAQEASQLAYKHRGCGERISLLQEDVKDIELRLKHAKEDLAQAIKDRDATGEAANAALAEADAMPTVNCEEIIARIKSADATNEKVRANRTRECVVSEHKDWHKATANLSQLIEKLRSDRIERMNAAKWPVTGLGFGEEGVTFGGLPFEQASSAEQLRIATSIGFAQQPDLRMAMIRDGSLLDADSLAAIAEVAAQHDGQLFIERVGEGAECFVVIEDGMVKKRDEDVEAQDSKPQPETAGA